MVWLGIALGVFLLFAALMYVPDWIRWIRWDARRKRMPASKQKGLRPPMSVPFWSNYAGPAPHGGFDGGGDAAGCGSDGGGDGGGGGCD